MDWSDLAGKVIGLGAPDPRRRAGRAARCGGGNHPRRRAGCGEPTPDAVNAATRRYRTPPRMRRRRPKANGLRRSPRSARRRWPRSGRRSAPRSPATTALQRWWRPLYALELSLLECPAFALTLLHALWIGHEAGINGFASLSALLMTYFGARFGVLGVYVTGRTREKQAGATGELPPSLIGEIAQGGRQNKKK